MLGAKTKYDIPQYIEGIPEGFAIFCTTWEAGKVRKYQEQLEKHNKHKKYILNDENENQNFDFEEMEVMHRRLTDKEMSKEYNNNLDDNENEELEEPVPRGDHNYCHICNIKYINYLEHIQSSNHFDNLKENRYYFNNIKKTFENVNDFWKTQRINDNNNAINNSNRKMLLFKSEKILINKENVLVSNHKNKIIINKTMLYDINEHSNNENIKNINNLSSTLNYSDINNINNSSQIQNNSNSLKIINKRDNDNKTTQEAKNNTKDTVKENISNSIDHISISRENKKEENKDNKKKGSRMIIPSFIVTEIKESDDESEENNISNNNNQININNNKIINNNIKNEVENHIKESEEDKKEEKTNIKPQKKFATNSIPFYSTISSFNIPKQKKRKRDEIDKTSEFFFFNSMKKIKYEHFPLLCSDNPKKLINRSIFSLNNFEKKY